MCIKSNDNDQLPKGYKQTEVGVIPEDWDVKELASLITAGPKNGYSGRAGGDARGTPTLRLTATSSGYLIINDETVKQLDEIIDPNSDLFLKPGDVLIQRSNTYELVGTTAIFEGLPKTYVYPDLMMRLRFSDQLIAHWFWKYANSTNGRRFFLGAAAGSTGSMPKISGSKLREMPVPLPPENERRSISQALSDVDRLIAALEKAIAKKRAIKTATMQQLLTGKTRLPGFGEGKGYKETAIGVIPEDWDVRRLGEVGQSLIGLTYSPEDIREYGTLVLRSSNVQNDRLAYENNVYVDSTLPLPSRVIVEEGDILICVRNGSKQLIGKCALIDTEAAGSAFGAFMSIFRTKIYGFVFYQFQSDVIQTQINEIMGATINQITNKDMAAFQIPLPPSDEEQWAIATVLSDMDTEIAALETRLAKTQSIKQGMMQQLLTGKVRLKIESDVEAGRKDD